MSRILEYLNIESELEDYDKIHTNIERDVIFRGTNLWILVFAIVVASVGLNMNSTAVIIGAMLISPLMGPINGLGYSIATYDFVLFRKSLKNFSFAVFAALVASSGYFMLSPVSTAHSELLARTSPTIYDVIIALFGGLAGILAISSRQKGNVIPGVAIATALMPPLCTAGYGLATAQFNYFFGAFFLFTINTVFIGISAVAMSQLLKFPIRSSIEPRQKKRITSMTTAVIVLTLIPSIYFGYKLVQKEKFNENAKRFIRAVGVIEGNYLMKADVNAEKEQITMIYAGNNLTIQQKQLLQATAQEFLIDSSSLIIHQGFTNIPESNREDQLVGQINKLSLQIKTSEDSINLIKETGKQLFQELYTLYPGISSVSYSIGNIYSGNNNASPRVYFIYITVREDIKAEDKTLIIEWLKKRLKTTAIRVVFD